MSKRKASYDHEMEECIKKMRTNPMLSGHKRPLEEDHAPNKRRKIKSPRLREAEEKLEVFRKYLTDIQLKFFHMATELRECRQEKEHLQTKYDALRRSVQDAQISWLRCGSHIKYLKSTAITNV